MYRYLKQPLEGKYIEVVEHFKYLGENLHAMEGWDRNNRLGKGPFAKEIIRYQ